MKTYRITLRDGREFDIQANDRSAARYKGYLEFRDVYKVTFKEFMKLIESSRQIPTVNTDYAAFISAKASTFIGSGRDVSTDMIHPDMFAFEKDIVRWGLKKGRFEGWEDCGLGKTIQQLEWARLVCELEGTSAIGFAPLSVQCQTKREGERFGIPVNIIENQADIRPGINITNYEKLGKFDYRQFGCVFLDESSILKSFSGATRNALINTFRNTPYRSGWSATPAPNDYMEIGNHAEFLGVMSRAEMLSTFFVHDGSDTAKWRLKGHAEDAFWKWVASWAVVMTCPGDLGYPNADYDLPPLNIVEHVVQTTGAHFDADGQMMLFRPTVQTLGDRRAARRNSLAERVRCAADIANATNEQVLVWCELNDESSALTASIAGAVEVKGADGDAHKITAMQGFTAGDVRVLVSKPSIAGWGMNWQNCHNSIFCGVSDSYEAWYQAIRRNWRFGQKSPVTVHMITSDAEGAVRENLLRKQREAERMKREMVRHTKDILAREIHGATRMTEIYQPEKRLLLPDWLKAA